MPVGKKRPLKTVALVVDGKVKQLKVARVELRAGEETFTGLRSQGGVLVAWKSSPET